MTSSPIFTLVAATFLCACPPGQVAEHKAPTKPGATPSPQAEIEMSGKVDFGGIQPAKVFIYATTQPCRPLADPLQPTGMVWIPVEGAHTFELEVFVPQKTVGHVCGLLLDAQRRVVGDAVANQDPLRWEGEGEVSIAGLQLNFSAVSPTRAAPAGMP